MTSSPPPDNTALVSTGVVARILGLEPGAIRAMIELGSLPEPQWMSLGRRVERVYTQEWVLLALDMTYERQLIKMNGLRSPFVPEGSLQFALRFESDEWSLSEITRTLTATQELWNLCARAVGNDGDVSVPLRVRRLSAGSPLDVLVTVESAIKGLGIPAAGVGLLIYLLKHPENLSEAIPRFIAGWHEQWARVSRSKTTRLQAKIEAVEFEDKARGQLERMKQLPKVSQIVEHDPAGVPSSLSEVETRPRRMFLKGQPQGSSGRGLER